jgi:hypothetical protein
MTVTLGVGICDDRRIGSVVFSEGRICMYCARGKRTRRNLHPIDFFVLSDCLHLVKQHYKGELTVSMVEFLRYGMHEKMIKKLFTFVLINNKINWI